WDFEIHNPDLRIRLEAPSTSPSFAYTGNLWACITPRPACGHDFQIRGEASVTPEDGGAYEIFEGTFEIVEGSGKRGFEGISGSGWLTFMIARLEKKDDGKPAGAGKGILKFSGMNEVGACLM
ncbi:MAG: hypothetical protein Q9168_007441, partial [Polycauliona sp. 1 TL-2023]